MPTALGEVVTALMVERFRDIIDVEFTANMENRLDDVEAGKCNWRDVLASFYKDFHREMTEAESALEGIRIKVPDEVTEEKCDECGRNMVIKIGRLASSWLVPASRIVNARSRSLKRCPAAAPSAAVLF